MTKKSKLLTKLILISLLLLPLFAAGEATDLLPQHKSGELINDAGTVYLIKDGKRHPFRTAEEFYSHGYAFEMVLPPLPGDLELPLGEVIKARSGTLVLDKNDGRTMYLVFDDGAHPFSEMMYYYVAGMEGRKLLTINLADYSKQSPIDFNFVYTQHPVGSLVELDGTVYLMTSEGRAGFPALAMFYSYGYDFDLVYHANDLDQTVPAAPTLSYRDGIVVNDGGTFFLVSEGKKYGFKTWEGFLSRGYKPSVVIAGDTSLLVEEGLFE